MANVAVTNQHDQAIPMQYLGSTGPRFRFLRRREEIVMDDSRIHQSITDLAVKGHILLDNGTTKAITIGFEAL